MGVIFDTIKSMSLSQDVSESNSRDFGSAKHCRTFHFSRNDLENLFPDIASQIPGGIEKLDIDFYRQKNHFEGLSDSAFDDDYVFVSKAQDVTGKTFTLGSGPGIEFDEDTSIEESVRQAIGRHLQYGLFPILHKAGSPE
ncbi:hypothetical protein [Acetobacter sp.]|jgi:hypothetical protein|uniref:hypothetical protein n=1 Tax=Acetobacter sp. TaxID=440 RepID=UPI0025B7BD06|nr:hypothetical protein [Acetobacter sp.]MCH4092157.1 hypothetical protein [Acetobacter sp.]MCI1299926.1 hypothetical protein [Acetobacter sp.]MCI1315944.1 hypothetical protein [Acetobacter sp.]